MSRLHDLVMAQDIEGVRSFMRSFPSKIDKPDESGSTPLAFAISAWRPSLPIIEMLLKAGANPQAPCPREYTGSVVLAAIKTGNVEVVRLLKEHGGDLHFRDAHNYTAMLNAVHGRGDRMPMVLYLVSEGVELNAVSSYAETPIRSAYRLHRFEVVKVLIEAGADESPLKWTRLMRAVTIGSRAEIDVALGDNVELEATDAFGQTILELAFLRADFATAMTLVGMGAAMDLDRLLHCAVIGGNTEAVSWLLDHGAEIEALDAIHATPLAAAAQSEDVDMVKLLLSRGAEPGSAIEDVDSESEKSAAILQALVDHSPGLVELDHERKRFLLGLGEISEGPLLGISTRDYLAGRSPVEGRYNPEDITQPFRVAMIRAGVNAYCARKRFDEGKLRSYTPRVDPVWCAQRFGQSYTRMPDGRVILIAGEHEDSYDPDFCIYNDVFVFMPHGEITIYGYPYSVFPPTDFHSATLVGDAIFIVGSLGYAEQRGGPTPVFRLDTNTYAIERIICSGRDPGWIYDLKATLVDRHLLRVRRPSTATKRVLDKKRWEDVDTFELDLDTRVWKEL
ncbi:MAG: ankyrin repeat domain-containing protein [Fimbriimonas sp.]